MFHSAVLGIHTDPTPAELHEIRRGEARAAAVAMGLAKDDARFFDYPDTALAEHLPAFREDVLRVLREHAGVTHVYIPHERRELNADHRLTGETVVSCHPPPLSVPRLDSSKRRPAHTTQRDGKPDVLSTLCVRTLTLRTDLNARQHPHPAATLAA
ncbi:MAG TPA: PIG-L family deacetylase [Streptomyces sp.]|jgi:GlcNAc-PI de-N-acetylase.